MIARRLLLLTAAAGLLAAGTLPSYADHDRGQGKSRDKASRAEVAACSGPAGTHRIDLTVEGVPTYGFYALPAAKPKGIVVFAHGHGVIAEQWQDHLMRAAARNGVIAVAMNYHGEDVHRKYGWRVNEGAADSIAVAQLFQKRCPTAKTIVMYGVSMGGNTAGLAAAIPAKRTDGKPLFDYLYLIEPVTNVTETYFEARAVNVVLPDNKAAKLAIAEIEEEMGGPPSDPAAAPRYLRSSVVTRGPDIKAAGIKGVVLVHPVDDGQAGYNQSQEMYAVLQAQRIPTDMFNVTTKQPGNKDKDTRLTGYATGPVAPTFDSPTVGHGSELSTTQLVITTGFDRLAALFAGRPAVTCRQYVVDGQTNTTTPPVSSAPAC